MSALLWPKHGTLKHAASISEEKYDAIFEAEGTPVLHWQNQGIFEWIYVLCMYVWSMLSSIKMKEAICHRQFNLFECILVTIHALRDSHISNSPFYLLYSTVCMLVFIIKLCTTVNDHFTLPLSTSGSWPTLSIDPILDLALTFTLWDSIFTSPPPAKCKALQLDEDHHLYHDL